MVSGILDQLQVFWQLYLIELFGGYSNCATWYIQGFRQELGVLVFFTNSGFMEFHVGYVASFHLFSLIDGFTWFRVGSPHKNIQLMLESLKVQFLVIYSSYYTLKTFLMMMPVILLSVLLILLSTVIISRYVICVNNHSLLLNVNLTY